jgi:hypothetical protein
VVGLWRGVDGRALIAALAWLTGFETAYQITALLMGTNAFPAAVPWLGLPGVIVVPLAARRYGVTPSRPWVFVSVAVWIVWIAFGFHANQHETPDRFSVFTEVLNETTKTVVAVAYLRGLRALPAPLRSSRQSAVTRT